MLNDGGRWPEADGGKDLLQFKLAGRDDTDSYIDLYEGVKRRDTKICMSN